MVEAITGATVTSHAIIEAVKDCLVQAGGNLEELMAKGPVKEEAKYIELTVDVAVVGGGAAGLAAAITAAENGAKVVLLEKMGALGGATITSGGEMLAAGTDMQAEQGIQDTAKALGEYWIERGEGQVDHDMLHMIADKSGESIDWLKEHGVPFMKVTFSNIYPTQDPWRNHKIEGGGAGLILPMVEAAQKAGVKVLTETRATSLINDSGVIRGVVADNKGNKVTVHAKSTILATGGYTNNEELMKEYAPFFAGVASRLGEAQQGDGLIMARDVGAKIVASGAANANPYDLGPTRFMDPGGIFLNVTPEGKRYSNEAEYQKVRSAILYYQLGFNHFYGIFDSSWDFDKLAEAIEANTVVKADSLEDLAKALNMDEKTFVDTVKRYNEMCDAGVDSDFVKPQIGPLGGTEATVKDTKLLNPILKAPFYAVKAQTTFAVGTFGGPVTNAKGEVLSTDEKVIPGLYAAGEVANAMLLYREYPCSGTAIQQCITMGRLAGASAAETAAK